jgi:hypothetical protein
MPLFRDKVWKQPPLTLFLPFPLFFAIFYRDMRLFQNPVGFETTSWKSGQMSAFPLKSKVAVPKTEVLEQPQR